MPTLHGLPPGQVERVRGAVERDEDGLVHLQSFFDSLTAAGVVIDRDAVRRHVEEIAPMIRDSNKHLGLA